MKKLIYLMILMVMAVFATADVCEENSEFGSFSLGEASGLVGFDSVTHTSPCMQRMNDYHFNHTNENIASVNTIGGDYDCIEIYKGVPIIKKSLSSIKTVYQTYFYGVNEKMVFPGLNLNTDGSNPLCPSIEAYESYYDPNIFTQLGFENIEDLKSCIDAGDNFVKHSYNTEINCPIVVPGCTSDADCEGGVCASGECVAEDDLQILMTLAPDSPAEGTVEQGVTGVLLEKVSISSNLPTTLNNFMWEIESESDDALIDTINLTLFHNNTEYSDLQQFSLFLDGVSIEIIEIRADIPHNLGIGTKFNSWLGIVNSSIVYGSNMTVIEKSDDGSDATDLEDTLTEIETVLEQYNNNPLEMVPAVIEITNILRTFFGLDGGGQ
jgi:hypothetical protein